jgi:thiol-disulfide isomerase/thioredoxin
MKRRGFVITAAAAGAAAAGAGLYWQLQRPAAPAGPDAAVDAETAGFWRMAFPLPDATPAGGTPPPPLQTARFFGQPLVLNFWGTWCPPCVKEMPELDRFAREHAAAGWRVLGLAVDNPRAVREFLVRVPVSYAIAMAGFEGSELARQLGNTQSGLPFTVLFGRDGRAVRRIAGETTAAALAQMAREIG